jgi:hypothetical protein
MQNNERMNRHGNKIESMQASSFSPRRRRMATRKVARFWMINQWTIPILLLAVVLHIQSAVVEAFYSQGSPSALPSTADETVAADTRKSRIGAFFPGAHRKINGHDREYNYQHAGMGKVNNKLDTGYAKGSVEGHLQRLERDKNHSPIFRSLLEQPPTTLTSRDLQIKQAPENEQLLQSNLETAYSVPLVFSLWLGSANNPDNEQYSTTAISTSSSSSFNIAELENATNPIHTSVVQSLWQLLCTRPDIQLLEGDVREDTDIVSPQEIVEEADACLNFLPAGKQRRFQHQLSTALPGEQDQDQEEEEATSVLRQTPILVRVELHQVENASTWTEWTTVFQLERVGYRYIQLARQENAVALASAAGAGDQDYDDDSSLTMRAAVEIMRESLQLLLDIAVLAGPMNQVISERLKTNFLRSSDAAGTETSTASSMATEETSFPYHVLSSPVGGELQAFPGGIPNVFSETSAGEAVGAVTKSSRRQPNTFDVAPLNTKRLVGISLFLLTIAGYATMLYFSRRQQRKRLLQENGDRVSATGDTSE